MNHSDSTEITERIRRIIEMENRCDRISRVLSIPSVMTSGLSLNIMKDPSGGKTLKSMRPAFCRRI